MIQIDPRPLTGREASVLRAVIAGLPDAQREAFNRQVSQLEVTATWGVESASIETRLPAAADETRVDVAGGAGWLDELGAYELEAIGPWTFPEVAANEARRAE